MQVNLKKQPMKYLAAVDAPTRAKLLKALERLERLDGDIVRLAGSNVYRFKIAHYRILFEHDRARQEITVIEINTRTNIKY